MLEKAFIESYRKLCDNNNDVIDEFIKRVDKALSEDTADKVKSLEFLLKK